MARSRRAALSRPGFYCYICCNSAARLKNGDDIPANENVVKARLLLVAVAVVCTPDAARMPALPWQAHGRAWQQCRDFRSGGRQQGVVQRVRALLPPLHRAQPCHLPAVRRQGLLHHRLRRPRPLRHVIAGASPRGRTFSFPLITPFVRHRTPAPFAIACACAIFVNAGRGERGGRRTPHRPRRLTWQARCARPPGTDGKK